MSKKCVNCGAELPGGAAFCPHCEASQIERRPVRPPRPWRKRAAAAAAALLLLAALAAAALWLVPGRGHQPAAYTGGAELIYPGEDGEYRLFLCFDWPCIEDGISQDLAVVELAADSELFKPSLFSAQFADSGEDAREEFCSLLESCTVEALPLGGGEPMEAAPPAWDEAFPQAALASGVTFHGGCGDNEVRWTLEMKNGDVLTLSHTVSSVLLREVVYTPEDAPMDTLSELSDLLRHIESEVDGGAVVSLYLPPVTYSGGLELSGRAVNLYGGTDGERRTTFTGTLTIASENPQPCTVEGIAFAGSGGSGLSATASAFVTGCEFSGWDVGAESLEGSWLIVSGCAFSANGVGLLFDSLHSHYSSDVCPGNSFADNGVGLRVVSLPGSGGFALDNCLFSGNGTDIEAPEGLLDSSGARFE